MPSLSGNFFGECCAHELSLHFSFQFLFSPLYPTILKPDPDLRFCQPKLTGEPSSLLPGNVLISVKNLFQLVELLG